jgi:hypothetical protein
MPKSRYSDDQAYELFVQFKRSKLTLMAFCTREGLTYSTIYSLFRRNTDNFDARQRLGRRFVYIDNSNLLVEGRRLSAVKKRMVQNIHEAHQTNKIDTNYFLDYISLHRFFALGGRVERISSYGVLDQVHHQDMLDAGFNVYSGTKSFSGHEKGVDVALATDMVADGLSMLDPERDNLILVSGDADYVPAVQRLKGAGLHVQVVFWSHGSIRLINEASEFTPLDDWLMKVGYTRR